MESGINKARVFAELTRSSHGDLAAYFPIGTPAAREEPEFFGHLIAWNHAKGSIRDSKVALPVIALGAPGVDPVLTENAEAHIASLDPRNLVRAVRLSFSTRKGHRAHQGIRKLVSRYLKAREADPARWDRAAMQHRRSMKELYALCHVGPNDHAAAVLFRGERPGVFGDIAALGAMAPGAAAGVILTKKIPFLVAIGALGEKAKDPRLGLALIEGMSPAELVNNTKMLERLGIRTVPALRGAYEAGLKRVAEARTGAVSAFKAGVAAAAVQDAGLKEKLGAVQQKEIGKIAVEGDWLVVADKSGSMERAIEAATHIAGTLAAVAKGKVWLVFVDNTPRAMDCTGKTLAEIQAATRMIRASGGTCLGCGIASVAAAGHEFDGIAVVSDGEENAAPAFGVAYTEACQKWGKNVPVYFYNVPGGQDVLTGNMARLGIEMTTFDLRSTPIDYYSLPNLVQTMRTNRYSLLDEVMAFPLLTMADVFTTAAA